MGWWVLYVRPSLRFVSTGTDTSLSQPSTISPTRPTHFTSAQSKMSDFTASVSETPSGFHVDGYEKISYDFTFLDGVFNLENPQLAECYKRWGRVLAVTDLNVYNVYGEQIERYFEHHGLELKVHKTKIGEKAKTIPTFLSIVDSMTEFGIYRKVLAIHFVSPDNFCHGSRVY